MLEQGAQLLDEGRPHVSLDEPGAHTVDADPVGSMRQREALDYADDRSFAGVIRQVSRLPTLPAIDARFTMTPRFCAIIVGSAA